MARAGRKPKPFALAGGDEARLRIRIKKAVFGPDRVVKSGSKIVGNRRLAVAVTCASGVFYTQVTDSRGRSALSRKVRLSCKPATWSSRFATTSSSASR